MPENWTDKPKEVSHWNEDGTFNSSFKKEQKKEFLEYEKEYLEQFEKGKSKSKKLKEKLKETEQEQHEARISRRLELEKASGKDYKKLLSELEPKIPDIEPEPKVTSKTPEKKSESKSKPSVESRISGMIKRVTSTKETSTKTADDTRNFIRKKRTTVESKTPPQSEVKSEPKVESKPKSKSQPTSDNVAENAKREELAKEALATRSNKTLPKGFNEESASGGPHAHDDKPEESQINSENDSSIAFEIILCLSEIKKGTISYSLRDFVKKVNFEVKDNENFNINLAKFKNALICFGMFMLFLSTLDYLGILA